MSYGAALLLAFPATAAPPDCTAAREGTVIYNKDHKIVQFCNGSQWIGMVAKIGGADDTLSGLDCQAEEVPQWNGSAWVCGQGGGGSPDCMNVSSSYGSYSSITVTCSEGYTLTGGSCYHSPVSSGVNCIPQMNGWSCYSAGNGCHMVYARCCKF